MRFTAMIAEQAHCCQTWGLEEGTDVDVRVATWNLAHWTHKGSGRAAWRYLLEELRPDIALVQECVPPAELSGYHLAWGRAYPWEGQPWGTGLLVRDGLDVEVDPLSDVDAWLKALPSSGDPGTRPRVVGVDGWLAACKVTMPDGHPTTIVSVHNPAKEIERWRTEGFDMAGIKLDGNRDLWLLDVLFHFLEPRVAAGERLIVGGDFNYSRALDLPPRGPTGNNEFFDRIAAEGFVSLHRIFRNHDGQTFFAPGKGAHQLDYLYTDARTANRCRSCTVTPYEQVRTFSDHAPIVAELSYAEFP